MARPDFYVVGTGIVGTTLARMARASGLRPYVLDAQLPGSCSAASGWLLKPSWLSGISRADVRWSYEQLEALYGLDTVAFSGPKDLSLQVLRWTGPSLPDRVQQVLVTPSTVYDADTGIPLEEGIPVAMCVGGWGREHLPARITAKLGASLQFDSLPGVPSQWRPVTMYRASTLLVRPDGSGWFGDGTAVAPDSWHKRHETFLANTKRRCASLGVAPDAATVVVGQRPFCDETLVAHDNPQVHFLTGTGKLGAGLAPLLARRYLTEVLRA